MGLALDAEANPAVYSPYSQIRQNHSEPIVGGRFMARSIRLRLSFAIVVVAAFLAAPASAAIKCKRGNQFVGGQWIATPYCQDQQLAQVAREYGIPASAAKIRNNPNFKMEVCRTVFNDIRVKITCEKAGIPKRI